MFHTDLNAVKLFCKLAMPEWVALIEEIERQFLTEFDYTREAQNLDQVSANMARAFERCAFTLYCRGPGESTCMFDQRLLDLFEYHW